MKSIKPVIVIFSFLIASLAASEETEQIIYDKVASCTISSSEVPIKSIEFYLGQKLSSPGEYVRAGVSFKYNDELGSPEALEALENRFVMGQRIEQKIEDGEIQYWVTEPVGNYFYSGFYIPATKEEWSTKFNYFWDLACKKTKHTPLEKPEQPE